MTRDLGYPLPQSLLIEAEQLMANIPDREDEVFRLRRFMGLVYAQGYTDGWMAAQIERNYDKNAPQLDVT